VRQRLRRFSCGDTATDTRLWSCRAQLPGDKRTPWKPRRHVRVVLPLNAPWCETPELVCRCDVNLLRLETTWMTQHARLQSLLATERLTVSSDDDFSSSASVSDPSPRVTTSGSVAVAMAALRSLAAAVEAETEAAETCGAACALGLTTGRTVLVWAAAQPRLYPSSRTMQQLCVLHSDLLQVVDALERLGTALGQRIKRLATSVVPAVQPSPSGDSGDAFAATDAGCTVAELDVLSAAPLRLQRDLELLGQLVAQGREAAGRLGETLSTEMERVAGALWAAGSAREGKSRSSSNGGVAVSIHGVAPSPAAHAVIEQLMTPLRAALEGLDGRTRVELMAAAAAAAAHAHLAHMKTAKVTAHAATQVPYHHHELRTHFLAEDLVAEQLQPSSRIRFRLRAKTWVPGNIVHRKRESVYVVGCGCFVPPLSAVKHPAAVLLPHARGALCVFHLEDNAPRSLETLAEQGNELVGVQLERANGQRLMTCVAGDGGSACGPRVRDGRGEGSRATVGGGATGHVGPRLCRAVQDHSPVPPRQGRVSAAHGRQGK
jgi:hypothetical protein